MEESLGSRDGKGGWPAGGEKTAGTGAADRDLATLSNYQQIRTRHIDLQWIIDWKAQVFRAQVVLTMEAVAATASIVPGLPGSGAVCRHGRRQARRGGHWGARRVDGPGNGVGLGGSSAAGTGACWLSLGMSLNAVNAR